MSSRRVVKIHRYDATLRDIEEGGIRINLPQSLAELLDICSDQMGISVRWLVRSNGDVLSSLYALPNETHLFASTSKHKPFSAPPAGKYVDNQQSSPSTPQIDPPETKPKSYLSNLVGAKRNAAVPPPNPKLTSNFYSLHHRASPASSEGSNDFSPAPKQFTKKGNRGYDDDDLDQEDGRIDYQEGEEEEAYWSPQGDDRLNQTPSPQGRSNTQTQTQKGVRGLPQRDDNEKQMLLDELNELKDQLVEEKSRSAKKSREILTLKDQLSQLQESASSSNPEELSSAQEKINELQHQLQNSQLIVKKLTEEKKKLIQSSGNDSLMSKLEEAQDEIQNQKITIESLNKQLEDSQKKIEQMKIVHEAQLLRKNRQADSDDHYYSESPIPTSSSSSSSKKEFEKYKEQIRDLELKCASFQDQLKQVTHERDLKAKNMEDIERRYDKKNSLLEVEAKRAIHEAQEAKNQLSAIRKETDSLRPKLAALDLLQAKSERLLTQVFEKDEQIKELSVLNEDLQDKIKSLQTKLKDVLNKSNDISNELLSSQILETETKSQNKTQIAPKKAFLMTPSKAAQAKSADDEEGGDDQGCPWLVEARGLLTKMKQSRVEWNEREFED